MFNPLVLRNVFPTCQNQGRIKIKLILAILLGLLAAGCAGVSVKPVYLSDGSLGHSISCNGGRQNMGACLEKAGEICGASGYTVFDERGSAAQFGMAQGGFTQNQGGFIATSGSMVSRNLFIKCKG